jgi:hypothetical protein
MKSIKSKLRCFLATLIMGLCCFGSAYAQTDLPSDAQVEEVLNTPDARTLHSYLLSQGYTDAGIIPGSQGVYDAASPTTGARAPGDTITITITIKIVIVTGKLYRKASGETLEATYALEKYANGTAIADASAENASTQLTVLNGQVKPMAKFSVSSLITRFENCWRQFGGPLVQNCVACYNCLKGCIVNTWPKWRKILCSLRCIPSCARCIGGIVSFVRCVVG